MTTLYIQEQGVHVRKKDQQIIITREGKTLQEVPINKLDQVVLMGRGVQISTALLVDLIGRGISVLLTNQQGSRHYATLDAGPSRAGGLRVQQMQQVLNPAWALALAQAMIAAKLASQRALLSATQWPSSPAALLQIDAAQQGLAAAATIDQVRGYEGAAASAYFGAWRSMFQQPWGFNGRAFHPPPDPLNAMLSFGYTLLLNDVLTAVQITGLDPYLGTFHVIEAGRPSLALDLMEEFRPLVVDQLVLELLYSGQLTRAQFERPPQVADAVYLNTEGRKLLIQTYEERMLQRVRLPSGDQTTLRRVLLLQAQAVARVIRGEQSGYIGYM